MANLESKSKFINIVVRKNDLLISERDNLIKKWCDNYTEYYAYIYHKNDLNIDNVLEREHLHLVCILHKSQRLNTTLNSFTSFVGLTTLGVEIDAARSYEGSIQYLIHKNDPQKTPHEPSEIVSNYPSNELNALLDTEIHDLTPQRLRWLVRTCHSNYELIEKLGISEYIRLRKVISDIREDFRIWDI